MGVINVFPLPFSSVRDQTQRLMCSRQAQWASLKFCKGNNGSTAGVNVTIPNITLGNLRWAWDTFYSWIGLALKHMCSSSEQGDQARRKFCLVCEGENELDIKIYELGHLLKSEQVSLCLNSKRIRFTLCPKDLPWEHCVPQGHEVPF